MTTMTKKSDVFETSQEMRGILKPGNRMAYVLAGKATITIRSSKTETRFTYRVRKSDGDNPVYFVALLSGPDNLSDYEYLGTIFSNGFRLTKKSRMTQEAPSYRAFKWFSSNWENPLVEVWHEGACGRCGRVLTVPESIESGIGPTCAGKVRKALTPPPLPLSKLLPVNPWILINNEFCTEMSDLGAGFECPKCGHPLSRENFPNTEKDRENETLGWTGVCPRCSTNLKIFND